MSPPATPTSPAPPSSRAIPEPIHVIGGGLAGCECAWQLASRGERGGAVGDAAAHDHAGARHRSPGRAGLLATRCAATTLHHPAGLLKREMESFGSLVLSAARAEAVPAGSALAVDRERFAAAVSAALAAHPRVELRREEVAELPDGDVVAGHRSAHLARAFAVARRAPGRRLPLLLRRHRAGGGGVEPRSRSPVRGLALRQGRRRRLPQRADGPRASTSPFVRPCSTPRCCRCATSSRRCSSRAACRSRSWRAAARTPCASDR